MASSNEINQFNEQWRSSPQYAQILQAVGVDPSQPLKLSDQQRKQVRALMEQQGIPLPKGAEIDPAGNANEPNNKLRNGLIGAGIGAAALTGLGAAGIGPMAGMLGGGGAAAGAGGAGAAGAGGGASAAGTAAAVVGGGAFSKIGGFLKNNAGSLIGAAGSAMGSAANSAAHNRGVQLEADIAKAHLEQQAERDYNDQLLRREDEGRKKERNAWEMLHRAAYVQNAPSDLNTTKLSTYSKSIAGPDANQRMAATGLGADMSKRLAEGNTIEMPKRVGTNVTVQQPGAFEKIGGLLAPVATGVGNVMINRQGGPVRPGQWWEYLGEQANMPMPEPPIRYS